MNWGKKMQVSVETTQGLERKVSVTVPAEIVTKEIQGRLRQLGKTQRIPGFRPGKVPVKVIEQRYGEAVAQDVAGDLMQKHFFEAIVAEKLNPAGGPSMAPSELKQNEDFSFVATFEVYPEVALKDLDQIVVEKPVAEIADADLNKMIETLQKQHASWEEVEQAAADGDKCDIDFVGSVDGEEFEGGKAENFSIEIGSDRMIPGFEAGVKGHKAADEFTIDVTFPKDYHAENLKGKAAKFAIKLNKVETQKLPELDESFFKLFGGEEATLASLKADVEKNMQRELEQTIKSKVKEQVLDGLIKTNELDIPKALISQEVEQLRQQAMQRFNQYNPDNKPDLPDELFTEQAERRVKVGLLLGEVIKVNKIEVNEERLDETIATMAASYDDPAEVIAYYKKNDEMLSNIRNVVIEDQAIDFLLEKAQVSEKTVQFDEFMKQGENAA